MATSLNPTDPVNFEGLSEEELLDRVLQLSLDPTQQENPEHQAFMRLISEDPEPIATSRPTHQNDTSKDFEYALRLQEEEEALQAPGATARPDVDTSNDEHIARQWNKDYEDDLELRREQEQADEEAKNDLVLRQNGIEILRNTYAPEDFEEEKEEEFQTVVAKSKKKKETPKNPGQKGEQRPIIIDGLNIARKYGNYLRKNNKFWDAKGLKLCYEYFVNKWNYKDDKISIVWKYVNEEYVNDKEILEEFKDKRIIVEASSRKVDGQRLQLDDDTLALDIALEKGGIIISFDTFRNHFDNSTTYRSVIKNQVIEPTFDHAEVRFHPKPFGDRGPTLTKLLRF